MNLPRMIILVVSYRNSTSNHNLADKYVTTSEVVSYRNSTSNHNGGSRYSDWLEVVSYRNSTSNHNLQLLRLCDQLLYLIEILHQTTTTRAVIQFKLKLYLIEILHQTTTTLRRAANLAWLYLIEILHQTTTSPLLRRITGCCILSKFYIKPQRCRL